MEPGPAPSRPRPAERAPEDLQGPEWGGSGAAYTGPFARAMMPTTPAPAGPTGPLRWHHTSPRAKRAGPWVGPVLPIRYTHLARHPNPRAWRTHRSARHAHPCSGHPRHAHMTVLDTLKENLGVVEHTPYSGSWRYSQRTRF